MQPFKESIQFYYSNAGALLLLAVTVLLPFSLIEYFIVNYVYFVTAGSGTSLFGDLADSFLVIIFLMTAQLPIIQYVQSELDEEEKSLLRAYRTFWEYGFSVYLFAILYAIATMSGLLLLVIPGIIILVYFYLTPFVTVMKRKNTRYTYKTAFHIGKKRFFSIFGLIALTTIIEILFSAAVFIGVSLITTNFLTMSITQTMLHLVLQPFFIVLFTMFLHKWRTESTEIAKILEDTNEIDHQTQIN